MAKEKVLTTQWSLLAYYYFSPIPIANGSKWSLALCGAFIAAIVFKVCLFIHVHNIYNILCCLSNCKYKVFFIVYFSTLWVHPQRPFSIHCCPEINKHSLILNNQSLCNQNRTQTWDTKASQLLQWVTRSLDGVYASFRKVFEIEKNLKFISKTKKNWIYREKES